MTSPVLLDPLLQLVGQEDGRLVPDQPPALAGIGRGQVERSAGGRLELDGVDPERVSAGQGDGILAQLEDSRSGTQRPAREMRCLVEPWQRLLHREVRPQRVDDALAVQTGTRGERQELDELGGLAAVPGRPVDGHAVQADGEPVEEPHIDVHRTMLVGGRPGLGRPGRVPAALAGSGPREEHRGSDQKGEGT
jgi:hypothetical protein